MSWLIGVLLEAPGGAVIRYYYAVAHPDRAQAEWTAADRAMTIGAIASSPREGVEPVEAVGEISHQAGKQLGLRIGETKDLGAKWPRRLLGPTKT